MQLVLYAVIALVIILVLMGHWIIATVLGILVAIAIFRVGNAMVP